MAEHDEARANADATEDRSNLMVRERNAMPEE